MTEARALERSSGPPAGLERGRHRRSKGVAAGTGWGPPDLLALVVLAALAVALFSPAWSEPSRALVGVPADNVLTAWCLGWVAHALAGGHSLLYSHAVGAPQGVNLLSSTPVVLAGLFLSPVTLLAGPVVAYDVAATGAVALSAWCAYLCLRRYAPGRLGPLLGGLVYGFSPVMLAQSYGHLQVTAAFTPPLLVILIDEALARRRRPAALLGAGAGLLLSAQLLLSSEVLATEVLMAAVLLVVLAVLHPRSVPSCLPRAAVAAAAAGLVFVVLAGWPLYMELAGPGHTLAGAIRGHDSYVNDLANLVAPTAVQALGPAPVAARFRAGLVESDGYLGIPLLAAVLFGLWRFRRNPAVPAAGLVGLVAVAFSLGPHLQVGGRVTTIPLPWLGLDHLPVLRDVLPSRMAAYADLAAGLILAVTVGEAGALGARRRAPAGR
ncbi:MAG: hypothetical protein ACRDZQ_07895, partial [Acidimicrobiales bacterium]